MPKVTFDTARCKGCSLCVYACPKKLLILAEQLNSKGFHPADMTDMDKCVGCASCATMCPDVVITVEK